MRSTSDLPLYKGFTLIELMIAIFVIVVLTLIAVPSYQSHIRKSRRQEAINQLLHMQLAQAKYRATHTSYGTLAQIGTDSSSDNYTYSVSNNTASAYTLTATAKTGTTQVNDTADGSTCTPLTLNQNNTKTPSACWSS